MDTASPSDGGRCAAARDRIRTGRVDDSGRRAGAPGPSPCTAPCSWIAADRVVRTRWVETARAAGERTERKLIGANERRCRRAQRASSVTSITSRREASSARHENQRRRRRTAPRPVPVARSPRRRVARPAPRGHCPAGTALATRRFARLRIDGVSHSSRRDDAEPIASASRSAGRAMSRTGPARAGRLSTAMNSPGFAVWPRGRTARTWTGVGVVTTRTKPSGASGLWRGAA